jgi:hypothetical protein
LFVDAVIEMLTGKSGFTVMVIPLEVAGLPVAQVAFEVTMQESTSVFTGLKVYVGFVAPDTEEPLSFQRYPGAGPPLMTEELKVTAVPAQTGFAEEVTEMLTGKSGLTVMVTAFEVAGVPVAQVAFEVRTQVIMLPCTGVMV